jgi:phospholipid transport system substrate-binding protein
MKNDAWRIYDVLVENVGLNSNYREQFNEILTKESPDQLIAKVEARVAELSRHAGQGR